MAELKDYYLQIDNDYTHTEKAYDFVKNQATWKYTPYMWIVENSPPKYETWIKGDPLLSSLYIIFGGWVDFYITRAKHAFNWHTDATENCSINMVFEEYNAHTLFSLNNEKIDIHHFTELKYIPKKWTIINTEKKHTVINFENRDRFLMCYRFPKTVNYNDVTFWYKNIYYKDKK